MQFNLNLIRLFAICLPILFYNPSLASREQAGPIIHIVYTGNLNCALDDCRCGDDIVGGMTRTLPVIDSLRTKYPNLVLVDAGDYLNSYTLPKANRLMLELISRAGYFALNLGDQEFVESPGFVFEVDQELKLNIPFLSANLYRQHSDKLLTSPIKRISHNGVEITVTGVIEPEAFEFISAEQLKITPAEKTLGEQQNLVNTSTGLQILLFHGTWERASALVKEFPWIDVVVLSHNQQRRYYINGETALVESGMEGEYLGHLQVERKGNAWFFNNEFIPVYKHIPVDGAAQRKVDEYYRSLRETKN